MDHAAALREQNALLADLLRDADPATPVPTCPGWTLRQLLTHVGRGDRWAAEIVRSRGPVDTREVPDGKPPADAAGWLAATPDLLLAAVAAAPDEPVWTFLGPRPARWWVRRRLHETTVHRADVALALDVPYWIDPVLAADGVSETLDLVTSRGDALPDGTTVHLHATDDGLGEAGEWMVRHTAWEHGHGKGTVAVRGTAADLLLAVTRRLPADDDRLQVHGDPAVLHAWLERAAF